MLACANASAALLADWSARAEVGGSDAHAMRSVGCAYTVVPGARDKREFLEGLRRGRGRVRGQVGGVWKLTRDVLAIGRNMVRENPWTLPVATLGVAVPVVILGNYIVENVFARWWMAQCRRARARGSWQAEAGRAVPVAGGAVVTLPQAMLSFISHRDHSLMRRVNRWPAPRWIRVWMICATRGGDGWLWYALGCIILLFGGADRFRATGAAALAAGVGIAVFLKIKKATGRKRPPASPTAGPRCCRQTSSRFLPATPSRPSP